ncbi:MAG: ferredoxin family protein [Anaerolineales bacterium]
MNVLAAVHDVTALQERLGCNVFKIDDRAHIVIDHETCRAHCRVRPCLFVCPANLYHLQSDGETVFVDYEGCLECGACLIVCRDDALSWQYPRAGHGVQYRFG